MGRAADILRAHYGADFFEREDPLILTAGVAAARVVADNGDRVGVHIINLSPNGVYVGRGADVSATKCLQYLAPSGGFFSLNVLEDFTLATRELYIIATAALSSVSTLEIVAR